MSSHRTTRGPSDRDAPITNYECVRGPRELTVKEADTGRRQDKYGEPFYAIKREDGYVGKDIGQNQKLPRIRTLYVSRDATRSFTLMHRATDSEDGEFAFEDDWPAVLTRPSHAGFATAARSIKEFRQLVGDLYPDAEEVAIDD